MKNNNNYKIPVYNIEKTYPSVEEARQELQRIIETNKKKDISAFKLIHGYGSTGRGGNLRTGLQKSLSKRKNEKVIFDFIPGEKYSPFDQAYIERNEEIKKAFAKDPDYGNNNPGITVVVLRN